MITNIDKVYNEIEVWAQLNHPNIIKIFELIDSEEHDYIYLIIELADFSQISRWDYKQEVYVRDDKIFEAIAEQLPKGSSQQETIERVAKFIFRQLAEALYYLHEEVSVIHRDVKLDNILYDHASKTVKLTDFTVSR